MRASLTLLQLAAAAATVTNAYVIPDDQQALSWTPVDESQDQHRFSKHIPSKSDVKNFFSNIESSIADISDKVEDALEDLVEDVKENADWAARGFKDLKDDTFERAQQTVDEYISDSYEQGRDVVDALGDKLHEMYFGSEAWLESTVEELARDDIFNGPPCHGPPHDGPPEHDHPPPWERPPHHGPPHDGPPEHDHPPPWERPPHHGPPHDGPPEHDHPPPWERPPHHGPPHDGPPEHDHPPPHGPPHERPPHHGPPDERPPHHGPPHERPPHHPPPPPPPPHHDPRHPPSFFNATVYQLISESKYTTKFTKLIDTFPAFVQLLNGTTANFTVFAPLDSAFEKFHFNSSELSSGLLQTFLAYHISSELYPAGRILVSKTVPTVLKSGSLGGNGTQSQRLTTNLGKRGLSVNFYSKVVVSDIFGTNGVIHGVDSLLITPPKLTDILNLVPGEFSTLSLGLINTGLSKKLNSSSYPGGSFFAPTNRAFKELDPRITAFLFSHYGLKYLKALLQYHATPGNTLYSDVFYGNATNGSLPLIDKNVTKHIPKGHFHFKLPTLLQNKTIKADVSRFGRFIDLELNHHNHPLIGDIPTADGNLHVIDGILIPPKPWKNITIPLDSETVGLEDFKAALEPYL